MNLRAVRALCYINVDVLPPVNLTQNQRSAAGSVPRAEMQPYPDCTVTRRRRPSLYCEPPPPPPTPPPLHHPSPYSQDPGMGVIK